MSTPISDVPDPWYLSPEGDNSWNPDATAGRYRMDLAYGTDPFHAYGTTFDDVWQAFDGHLLTPPLTPGDDAGVAPDMPDMPVAAVDVATVTAALDATAARIPQTATLPPVQVGPWMAGMLLSAGAPADSGMQPLQTILTDIAGPYSPSDPHSWDEYLGADQLYGDGYTDGLLPDFGPSAQAQPWESAQALDTHARTQPLTQPDDNTSASRPWLLDARYPGGLSLPAPPAPTPAAGKRPRDHTPTTAPADTPHKRPRHHDQTQTQPARPQPTTAGIAGTASEGWEWLLSAALSNDTLREIVNAGTASGHFPFSSIPPLTVRIEKLGARLGVDGTSAEVRHQLRERLKAGQLRDPGTYHSPSRATAAVRPHPSGIPTDPVEQWLLDAALSDLSNAAIARRAQQAKLALPHRNDGIGLRIEGLGHALGATGTSAEVRSKLREWRDAGLLVHDGHTWTATTPPGVGDTTAGQDAPVQSTAAPHPPAPHATTPRKTRNPTQRKPTGRRTRLDTSAWQQQQWLLSAALSNDTTMQISANGKVSGCYPRTRTVVDKAFEQLGVKLGLDGTAGEIRRHLKEQHLAGNLVDPGTYKSAPEATGPDPNGIPTDPAEQWLLGAALIYTGDADIARDAQLSGWNLPASSSGITRRITAIGNALGATGKIPAVRRTLQQWHDAGHLVHDGTKWTVRDQPPQ
ncbi:hypothetical protein [Streptomyces vinaceus]|uniref:hypothetical protein n=1 Tax=Streptomyces vinaceus TaxID=1960 RepID=UPI0036A3ADE3